jgi:hypothetical protein
MKEMCEFWVYFGGSWKGSMPVVICLPFSGADYGNFVFLAWLTGLGHFALRCRSGWMVLDSMLASNDG